MRIALAFLLALAAGRGIYAKSPIREWKTGKVTATAFAKEQRPARANAYAAIGPSVREWQGYVIVGPDYVFLVACPVDKKPNVAVNESVKYGMAKGKFYLLDEDGRELEMKVVEKRVTTPADLPKSSDDGGRVHL